MYNWFSMLYCGKLTQHCKPGIMAKMKIIDMENRLVVAKGEGEGVGWMGAEGLKDANYCLWNGLAMRSCCVALGTMSNHF